MMEKTFSGRVFKGGCIRQVQAVLENDLLPDGSVFTPGVTKVWMLDAEHNFLVNRVKLQRDCFSSVALLR